MGAVVIGAGFAGLRAARDLADAGEQVVLLETRERVGGRTWTRPFAGDGPPVEIGGSWFTPEQREAPAELARYGLGVRTYGPPSACRWLTAGELRTGLPVPFDELNEFEAALVRIAGDAAAVGRGVTELGSLSCAEYLDRLGAPRATREFLTAWYVMIGGADPAVGAAVDALSAIAGHGGATGLLTALRFAPEAGWSALAAAMAEHARIDLRLDSTAIAVRQQVSGVEVTLADGASIGARFGVVALPVNVLPEIAFEPALPAPTAEALGSNAGAAVKVWFRARNVPSGSLAAGAGEGIHWLYADRAVADEVLLLGFGYRTPGFDPAVRLQVERALCAFFPEAELVGWDWHDWNADPASRGTYATAFSGRTELLSHDRFPPHGRIAFATSDVAPSEAGWIEGALVAGAEAARRIRSFDD